MLKIYGRANSINVRKVLWLAEELGLAYEREDWGRGFRPLSDPEFAAMNPLRLIPAIDDDGFQMSESNATLRYLAGKHGAEALFPSDLRARAQIDRWMDWQATELTSAWRGAFLGGVMKLSIPGGEAVIKASMQEWPRKMLMIEQQLASTGGHIAGPAFTLADIPIGLIVHRWYASDLPEMERPDMPATAAYYDRLSGRPPFMAHGRNGMP